MADDAITGGCLCGAVRYVAAGPILAARQCWCRDCQYWSCGNAANNVIVPSDGLAVTGRLAEYRSVADSGSHMVRRFCPTCGTQLFSAADERPGLVVIRTGTLDDPGPAAPTSVIWTAAAPGWAHLDPALAAVAGQPGPIAPPKEGG